MTNDRLEDRLADWYRAEAGQARVPVSLVAVLEHLPEAPSRRVNPWFSERSRFAPFLVAAAVVVVAAVSSILLEPAPQTAGLPPAPASDTPGMATASPTTGSPSPRSRVDDAPTAAPGLPRGRYELPWPQGPSGGRVFVTVPAGWSASEDGRTLFLTRGVGPWGPADPGLPQLAVLDVWGLVPEICASSKPTAVPVGPTAGDLAAALEDQRGWLGRQEPSEVTVGGYPATKIALMLPGSCPEAAEGVTIATEADGTRIVPLEGRHGTVTLWIVDVDGDRLVLLTSDYPDTSTTAERSARDGILASLRILPGASTPPRAGGG